MSNSRPSAVGHAGNMVEILTRISPGTQVDIWFDDSGFRRTTSQSLTNNQATFSGGSLDGGLTYINPNEIRAIRIGSPRG